MPVCPLISDAADSIPLFCLTMSARDQMKNKESLQASLNLLYALGKNHPISLPFRIFKAKSCHAIDGAVITYIEAAMPLGDDTLSGVTVIEKNEEVNNNYKTVGFLVSGEDYLTFLDLQKKRLGLSLLLLPIVANGE
jgi:hypothetical protein